jgi:hypothetical protein
VFRWNQSAERRIMLSRQAQLVVDRERAGNVLARKCR